MRQSGESAKQLLTKSRLKTAEIKGLWNREGYKIGFEEDVRVLIGANGSGKSRILQLLTIALQQREKLPPDMQVEELRLIFKDDSCITYSQGKRTTDKQPEVNVIDIATLDFVGLGASPDNSSQNSSATWIGRQLDLQLDGAIRNFFALPKEVCEEKKRTLKEAGETFLCPENSPDLCKELEFFCPLQFTDPAWELAVSYLERIGEDGLIARVKESNDREQDKRKDPDKGEATMHNIDLLLLDHVTDILVDPGMANRLLPGILDKMEQAASGPTSSLAFRLVKGNKQLLPFWVLSSGERQILLILLRVITELDPLKLNILILDEPEISLHLDWQAKLLKTLSSLGSNLQIILATHSPGVVMESYLAAVVKMDSIRTKK